MFNRKILGIFVFLTASRVFATGYLGGNIGFSFQDKHTKQIGIYGGYGGLVMNSRFYLGGELGLESNYMKVPYITYENERRSYHFHFETLSLSAIPGFMLSENFMLYGRVGTEYVRENHYAESSLNVLIGLGLQSKLSDHWSIRGEVVSQGVMINYPFYSNLSNTTGKLGLSYQF